MYFIRFILVLLIAYSSNASARMYQWIEPDTGTTQLSGKPPAWYRSVAGGPRVFVFDNGRLIDDTALKVSEDIRQLKRQQAFILAEENRQQAQEKLAKANRLKAEYTQNKQPANKIIEPEEEVKEEVKEVPPDESQASDEQNDEKTTADKLREMISDWEKNKTEKAKQALE